jgi:hypothetical protein
MEDFALRYLVSGMYAVGRPDPRALALTLRAFTLAYLTYVALTAMSTTAIALLLNRLRHRYLRTAGTTFLFAAILMSPVLYQVLLDGLRPAVPRDSLETPFIHTANGPVVLVLVGAAALAIALRARQRPARAAAA